VAEARLDRPAQLAAGSLKVAFFLTLIILVLEAAAGFVAHSIALLADAGHIFTDVLALGLAWFAVQQAKRPHDEQRTYGYHRVGTLVAMVNGTALVLIVGAVGYEAVRRLGHPERVQGGLVIAAALVAIAANLFINNRLQRSDGNLNVRAAKLHVLGDLAASVGVVASGAVILLTGWLYADPIISLVICALIALGAWQIVRESIHTLLEGTPSGIDLAKVRALIESSPGIESVHDLHVWALSSEQTMLSCHVVVPESLMSEAEHTMRRLEQEICERFGIGHTTIQLEACHPCESDSHLPGEHNHPHAAAGRSG
jgi:cobalt-zinc-cadmium efflux system protein